MTCCFCGTRSVLQLRELRGHKELTCRRCAAPIHNMKLLKTEQPKIETKLKAPPTVVKKSKPTKPEKSHKRRKWFKDLIEDVWDELEDIFD